MADLPTNTDAAEWTSALENCRVANLAWSAVKLEGECSARQQVGQVLGEALSSIVSTEAPHVGAVIEKLSMWWGEDLFDDTYASSLNRIVIGDLRRIEMIKAGVEEAEASGRTPGEAAESAAKWRAAHAKYCDLVNLLVEGDASVAGAINTAAGELLELSAPNIAGVVRKLELLWQDDRYDDAVDGTFCFSILRDLSRLGRPSEGLALRD